MPSRGIRNNNPGNIDYNPSVKWKGLDTDTPTDGRFCRFTNPQYGIRAMVRILKNYKKKYNLNTVKSIIERWAPPHENDTASYVKSVSGRLNVAPNQFIQLDDAQMLILVKAIIKHENGVQPYSDDIITLGIALESAG